VFLQHKGTLWKGKNSLVPEKKFLKRKESSINKKERNTWRGKELTHHFARGTGGGKGRGWTLDHAKGEGNRHFN